jgi:hypothetical protein
MISISRAPTEIAILSGPHSFFPISPIGLNVVHERNRIPKEAEPKYGTRDIN